MRLAKGLLAMSLLCAGVISSASATEVNTVNVNTNNSLVAESTVEARGFTKERIQYIKKNDTNPIELIHDTNWDIMKDNKVRVALIDGADKNAKIRTRVYYKNNNNDWIEVTDGAYDLQIEDSNVWNIPKGAEFKVTVAWGQGSSGDYKFEIKLYH